MKDKAIPGPADQDRSEFPPIYIVSGGTGASGERLVQTVLVQFPQRHIPVVTVNHVRQLEQIEQVVVQAAGRNGTIVHTLIDDRLRRAMKQLARKQGVVTIDLMGDLLSRLTEVLGQSHLNQPGRYQRLNQAYFDRMAAIDFALAHDDGKNRQDWSQAEIILVGVSRTGKTPLSIYLSVLGWRVANVPIIAEVPLPELLWQVDPRRLIGLNIQPGQLVLYRQTRRNHLGLTGPSAYTDPAQVYEEVEAARRLFRKQHLTTLDVTDQPIETSAAEIIRLLSGRLGLEARLETPVPPEAAGLD